jgi:hypothetical protein
MLSASYRFLVKRAGSVAGGLTRVGGVRSYVAPMKDVDFLIKDVWDVPAHYKALGYDDQVRKEYMHVARLFSCFVTLFANMSK